MTYKEINFTHDPAQPAPILTSPNDSSFNDSIEYFRQQLSKVSMIPKNRFGFPGTFTEEQIQDITNQKSADGV